MAANVLVVVDPPQPTKNPVYQYLSWIGFFTEINCNSIHYEGGLEAFDDFSGLTESDIQDIASGFSRRTIAQGRINFGM